MADPIHYMLHYSKAVSILTGQDTGCVAKFLSGPFHSILTFKNIGTSIQGVFEVEAFPLTCDSMRCSN
jgi:hypothetical protein